MQDLTATSRNQSISVPSQSKSSAPWMVSIRLTPSVGSSSTARAVDKCCGGDGRRSAGFFRRLKRQQDHRVCRKVDSLFRDIPSGIVRSIEKLLPAAPGECGERKLL